MAKIKAKKSVSKKPLIPPKNRLAFIFAVIASAVIALYILATFSTPILVAMIAAYSFMPVMKWFEKKTKRTSLSAALTILTTCVVIIIPLILFIIVSINQVNTIVNDAAEIIDTSEFYDSTTGVTENVNRWLGDISGGQLSVSQQDLQNATISVTKALGEGLLNFLSTSFSSIPSMITSAIIFFFVYGGILTNRDRLIQFLKQLNPLGKDMSEMYLDRAGKMTTSIVKGQLAVAVSQGVLGAVFLYIAGIEYFAFFAFILSLLSIVPLGGGIITIPIGIIMILTGNIWQGVFILLTHFIVITNIDNIIRPRLVPDDLSLHPALLLISVFSGVAIFGFIGIVVGPVLFIVAITTLGVYAEYQARLQGGSS